jgi:hypothetical protein
MQVVQRTILAPNPAHPRWVERTIVARHEKEPRFFDLHATIGWKDLQDEVALLGAESPLTALVPALDGIDPDDAFSSVPYEKVGRAVRRGWRAVREGLDTQWRAASSGRGYTLHA